MAEYDATISSPCGSRLHGFELRFPVGIELICGKSKKANCEWTLHLALTRSPERTCRDHFLLRVRERFATWFRGRSRNIGNLREPTRTCAVVTCTGLNGWPSGRSLFGTQQRSESAAQSCSRCEDGRRRTGSRKKTQPKLTSMQNGHAAGSDSRWVAVGSARLIWTKHSVQMG